MADETPPTGAAKPAEAPKEAPKKKSKLRRFLKFCFFFFVFVAIVLAILPTVASKTFLTGVARGQMRKQLGESSDVSKVEFGWTEGALIEGVKLGAGTHAKVKDRAPVTLDRVKASLSVPGLVKAAATGGEAQVTLEAEKANVYLELLPDGKTNLPLPEGEKKPVDTKPEPAPTETKPAGEAKKPELPCSAMSRVSVKAIDLEVADMTSSTGAIQRIVLKNLQLGLQANVGKDLTANVDTAEKGAPTVGFDELKISLEQPGKPTKLLIAVEKPEIVAKLTFAGSAPASASTAPFKALGPVHQLDAKPTIHVKRIYNDDVDIRDAAVDVAVENAKNGPKQLVVTIKGTLAGPHAGTVLLAITADLGSKPRLPVTIKIDVNQVDVNGMLSKALPSVFPVLDGQPAAKMPTITLATSGAMSPLFKNELDPKDIDKDATVKSSTHDGKLQLGPASWETSKVLEGFLKAFEQLELKDILVAAMGPKGLSFDGILEEFNIREGTCNVPKGEMKRDGFGLDFSGSVTLDGNYKLKLKFDQAACKTIPEDIMIVLRCVDDAGGIGVEGTLGGEPRISFPDKTLLGKALVSKGAVNLLRKNNPKLAAKLDGALTKMGVSAEDIVNDPAKAATKVVEKKTEEQVDKALGGKEAQKIKEKTGIDPNAAKEGIKGLFGGDDKKTEPKKDDKGPSLPKIPNPFGG